MATVKVGAPVEPSVRRLPAEEMALIRLQISELKTKKSELLIRKKPIEAATANMTAGLDGELHHASKMFDYVDRIVSIGLRAEHTQPTHVPDPNERNPQ